MSQHAPGGLYLHDVRGALVTDIATWLRQQLDEDERVALAVSEGPRKPEVWEAKEWLGVPPRNWAVDCPFGAVVVDGSFRDAAFHIARHDPARVLRDVAAKRALLDLHRWQCCARDVTGYTVIEWYDSRTDPCPTLRVMTAPYADRDGYDPSWAIAASA